MVTRCKGVGTTGTCQYTFVKHSNTDCVISLQTILHHVFLWGSIILSFVWFVIFGALRSLFWEMYFVPFVTMATKEFWAVCTLSAVAALLPRYCGVLSFSFHLWVIWLQRCILSLAKYSFVELRSLCVVSSSSFAVHISLPSSLSSFLCGRYCIIVLSFHLDKHCFSRFQGIFVCMKLCK